MYHTVSSVILMVRAHKKISAEREECLKYVLNKDIRTTVLLRNIMHIASAKGQRMRGASYQPAFMASCLPT